MIRESVNLVPTGLVFARLPNLVPTGPWYAEPTRLTSGPDSQVDFHTNHSLYRKRTSLVRAS